MTDTVHCPDCGLLLPPDAPQGECPRCLLKMGFESQPSAGELPQEVTRTSAGHSHFVPPTVAELQARIPQYEILELIGQGGMGAVYKARQRGLERLVAIKILPFEISQSAAFTERFAREARALAMLSHPHIVAVHDFGQTPGATGGQEAGLCYFVMEYVAGVNLRQALQSGKMNPAEALAIVPQICEALQYAHDEGVVHRDIKPENILIDVRGRVKIADFGLAKLLGTQTPEHSLTGTQQVMGTLRYMAPEQMFGSKEVDHRADIFSLGVVFYELLTGELPIGRFAPPSKKAAVDARLDEVVLRALESEPAQRYQHVSELKTGVEAVARKPAAPSAALQNQPAPSSAAQTPQTFVGTTYHLLLCFGLSLLTLWFVLYFVPPVVTMMTGPDTELLNVGKEWDLGRNVQTILSSIVVLFVALVCGTAFAWWKYREAGRQHLRASGALLPLTPAATGDQPKLSQAALWGAILAPLFLFAVLMFVGSSVVVHRAGPGEAGAPLMLRLVAMLLLIPAVIGLFSPFSTTLLGILAISQIRNSKGKLYGLPLAVFDALAYPLLFLNVILLVLGYLLLAVIIEDVLQLPRTSTNMWPLLLTALLGLPVVIALDVWLVMVTWRAASRGLSPSDSHLVPIEKKFPEPPPFQANSAQQTSNTLLILVVILALTAIPLLGCGIFVAYFFTPLSSAPAPIAPVRIDHAHEEPTEMILPAGDK